MPLNGFAVNALVFASERELFTRGQISVTVSGLKRGLVYPKKFLLRMRSCIRLHTANYGERRKGFEQE